MSCASGGAVCEPANARVKLQAQESSQRVNALAMSSLRLDPLELCTTAQCSPTLSSNANPSILPRTAVVAMIARKNFRGGKARVGASHKGKRRDLATGPSRPGHNRPRYYRLIRYTIRAHKWLIQ